MVARRRPSLDARPSQARLECCLPVPILEFLGSPTFRRRALMSAPSISGISHPGGELAELLHDPSVNADQFSTKTIVLVQDNLSIHSKASLYEAFPAVEARRLVEGFELHYT